MLNMDIILQLYSTVSVLSPNIDMLLFGLELKKKTVDSSEGES